MDAHIVSQVIGDAFFPVEVFLEPADAAESKEWREAEYGQKHLIHVVPLHTGGWYLH